MGKGTNSTTTSTAPNPQAMQVYQDLLARAQGVSNTPYTPYGGELVAGVNQQQTTGIGNINANANFAQPYIQQAAGMVQQASQPITAAQIQQYESPYTRDVVNATQAQFANENAQQMQGVRGNAIAQGAFGGNREAIAEAETANQQQKAQAPVIAGLMNQGYQTGLNTALTEQQALASGAYGLGNLGVSGQGAALSGAGAQIGAGTLQQGTQQALDQARYQQFINQQAYPFQTAQWLAALGTGVGSQMGGTSQTTAPPPNPWAQFLGAGLAGASLFAADGGRIYGDFAHRRHGGGIANFDDGGGVIGSPYGGGMPYAGSHGWVPSMGISPGRGAPPPPGVPQQQQQPSAAQEARGIGAIAKGVSGSSFFHNPSYGGGSALSDDAYGGSSSNPLPGLDASDYGAGFRAGGRVGYDFGGGVAPSLEQQAQQIGSLAKVISGGYAAGGVANLPMHNRITMPRGYADGGGPDFPDVQGFGEDTAYPFTSEKFGPPQQFGPPAPSLEDQAGLGDVGLSTEQFGPPRPPIAPEAGVGNLAAAPLTSTAAPGWAGAVGAEGIKPGSGVAATGVAPVDGIPGAWNGQQSRTTAWPETEAPPLQDMGTVARTPGSNIGVAGIPAPFVSQVQHSEGFEPKAKWDYKQYTNGYGTKARFPGEVISEPEARKRFDNEFGSAANIVDSVNPNLDPGTRAALTSLTFNAGNSWVNGKLGEQIRSGDLDGARQTFLQYNKADGKTLPGLEARRQREAQWFGGEAPPTGEGTTGVAGGRESDVLPKSSAVAEYKVPGEVEHASTSKGFGLGLLSPNVKSALMAAGLGMMASRSPFLGTAIGEGGLQGFGAYTHATELEQQRAMKQSEIDLHAKKLDQEARQFQENLALRTKPYTEMTAHEKAQIAEQGRQHDITEARYRYFMEQGKIPPGYRVKDGNLEAIPGGPADLERVQKTAAAKRPPMPGMTPEQEEVQSRQIATGNLSPLTGLPRTPEGLAVRNRLRNNAAQIIMQEHPEMSPTQVAERLNNSEQEFKARQIGINTEARTSGNREANLNLILRTADAAIPAAIEASEKAWRTGWVPINKLIQHGEVMASNPELAEFGMANLQLAEHWARAMNPTGVMRESDRDKALAFLSTAQSPETYKRIVMQLQKQITRERDAVHSQIVRSGPDSPIQTSSASPNPGGELTSKDHAALEWANAHPKDPRAVRIKQSLGMP